MKWITWQISLAADPHLDLNVYDCCKTSVVNFCLSIYMILDCETQFWSSELEDLIPFS